MCVNVFIHNLFIYFCQCLCCQLLKIQLQRRWFKLFLHNHENPTFMLQHSSEALWKRGFSGLGKLHIQCVWLKNSNHFLKNCGVCPHPVFNPSAENENC